MHWTKGRFPPILSTAMLFLLPAVPVKATLIDLQLRAVATKTTTDTITDLPKTEIPAVGGPFYLEIWITDVGSPSEGISGVYLDIAYDTQYVDAMEKDHGGIYTVLTFGTIDDPVGLVDEFGGSYLGEDRPAQDEWALLGRLTMQRIRPGTVTLWPQESDDECSRFSAGGVNWHEINAPPLVIPEPNGILLMTMAGSSFLAIRRRRLGTRHGR